MQADNARVENELKLTYNKTGLITNEILEIVGGAEG
jgi:F0F1-type ATP synthase gamma subunit